MTRRSQGIAFEASNQQPLPLGDLPIGEPEHERLLLEKMGYQAWLAYLSKVKRLFFLPGEISSKISQVYQSCYELSRNPKIITAFVAHFPAVAFESPWLATLVRFSSRQPPEKECEFMKDPKKVGDPYSCDDQLLYVVRKTNKNASYPNTVKDYCSACKTHSAGTSDHVDNYIDKRSCTANSLPNYWEADLGPAGGQVRIPLVNESPDEAEAETPEQASY